MTMRSLGSAVLLVLSAVSIPASLAAQDPLRWNGVEMTLPKGWTTKVEGPLTMLAPPDWKPGTKSGEAYGLLFDAATKDLGADDLDETIDAAAEELMPNAKRKSGPKAERLGAFDGKTYGYEVAMQNGERVELRIHVFPAKDGTAAMFALGYPAKVAARNAELTALLGSLIVEGTAKPKRRAFGLSGTDKPAPAKVEDTTEPKVDEPPAAPAWKRIPGGREVVYRGVAVDIPKAWRVEPSEDGTQLLMPPGFGESGVLEEIFALCGDGSLRSLDAPDAVEKVREGLDEVQPGLRLKNAGKAVKFGGVAGRVFEFTGSNPAGQPVEARVYAFATPGDGVHALLALGFPQKLKARSPEIDAILGSMRTPGGAARSGDDAAGGVAAELVGQWVYAANVNANDGGGRSSQIVLTLRGDGSYTYRAENVSTNPLGGAWGTENDAGRWSLSGATMTFRSQSGTTTRFALEKRNHPRNNDPMLVFDGRTFVTATKRAPW